MMTMRRVIVGVVMVALWTGTAAGQGATPYNPPGPGWVLIQPCGADPGWVPPDHPLASTPTCQPVIPATADRPWTLAPAMPLEVGKLYTNPYHLVLEVISATVVYRWDPESGTVRPKVVSMDALLYQSRWWYDVRQNASAVEVDLEAPRGAWWEIAR